MRWMTWIVVAVLLAGCQAAMVKEARWFRPSLGSEVVVKAPLTVPADAARVFLQRGEVMGWGEVRQLKPHCHFEVREVFETTQTIRPDTFRVTGVRWGYEQVVRLGAWRVAQAVSSANDGLPPIARYVRLDLASAAQPNVMRLTCHGPFEDWEEAEEPTPAQILTALGDRVAFVSP